MVNFKQNARLKSALFWVVYAAFLMVVAELATRLFSSFVIRYDIEMTRYALELKTKPASPNIGFLHAPMARAHLMNVDIETNSMGLRSPEAPMKSKEKYRLLFLGDSLTLGWGVSQADTFATRLEHDLRQRFPIEVVNAGHGNFNTLQEASYFFEIGQHLEPQHVVLFYFINDAEVMQKNPRWGWLGHSRFITLVWSFFRSFGFSHDNFATYYKNLYQDDPIGWRVARESLARLYSFCRERNITFQVVILPDLHSFNPYPFLSEHQLINEFLATEQIPHLDVTDRFQDVSDPQSLWVARDDAHPNAKAHEMIGNAAKPFILQPITTFFGKIRK